MGLFNISYTEEEKEEMKRITLIELQNGKNIYEIERIIGVSSKLVDQFKRELINKGKITEEKIYNAIEKRRNEEREKRDKKAEVLEDLRSGYMNKEIAQRNSLTVNQIDRIKKELISDRKITQYEIDVAKAKRQEEKREEEKKIVLEKKRAGKSDFQIANDMQCEKKKISRIIKELVEERKNDQRRKRTGQK